MEGDFFVVLYTQNGGYTPLVSGEYGDIAKYQTEDEARTAAQNNMLGETFGFEIFEIGMGET